MAEGRVDSMTMADGALQELIARTIRAPSSHNTQPWRFRPERGGVSVLADRERRLPVNDPADRELTISCGCALMNLRVATAAAGRAYRLDLLPEGERSSSLARMTWQDGAPDAEDASLASAIETRHTWRERFAPISVSSEVVEALAAMAEQEGARLQEIEQGKPRREAARLVAQGDAVQWRDPSWRRELAGWIRPRRLRDGLAVPGPVAPFARMVVRTFDMGQRVGRHDAQLAEDAPRLMVLSTNGDERIDWLHAGQALERVLLAASQLGLQASYLNQPVQVASLRPRLCDALGVRGHPQILLRLGYPQREPVASPRRRVAELVEPVPGLIRSSFI
ncbi:MULTISPECIES: nitroreductase family protein [unclassified Guyparkeria]|uniref:Acg family FMN-binding oxidoreductase n=1 Tax=unclassified Guyparkeria TaxID=2626246 RepID=UPI0007336F03|nr:MULTISPECIES: nitroreductase family protein [unclassified Guyparkeria]KTG17525.1 hypothetical protein AUR63_07665 [Guyparkeria sp. XI15]OAE88340.1 hypothetical protein AWR35_07680 [Guyparkeria sp. WRN-7]